MIRVLFGELGPCGVMLAVSATFVLSMSALTACSFVAALIDKSRGRG